MKPWRTISRLLMALFFIAAGLNHFRRPEIYLAMMPPYLQWPETLNLISGAAEIAGGTGALVPVVRNAAGWGLIVLLAAVFPANIHLALQGWPEMDLPRWVLWARLPLQGVFIAWVYDSCLRKFPSKTDSNL